MQSFHSPAETGRRGAGDSRLRDWLWTASAWVPQPRAPVRTPVALPVPVCIYRYRCHRAALRFLPAAPVTRHRRGRRFSFLEALRKERCCFPKHMDRLGSASALRR